MAERNNKYAMFRNYMFNELQISKEDIRQWIKEAVAEQVTTLIRNTYGKFDARDEVRQTIKHLITDAYGNLNYSFSQEIAKDLLKHLELKLK